MGAVENLANKMLFLFIKVRQSRSNVGLDGLRFQRVGALIYQENFLAARAIRRRNPHLSAPGGVFVPATRSEEPAGLKSQIATSNPTLPEAPKARLAREAQAGLSHQVQEGSTL